MNCQGRCKGGDKPCPMPGHCDRKSDKLEGSEWAFVWACLTVCLVALVALCGWAWRAWPWW